MFRQGELANLSRIFLSRGAKKKNSSCLHAATIAPATLYSDDENEDRARQQGNRR
jgi:hypothetical protein